MFVQTLLVPVIIVLRRRIDIQSHGPLRQRQESEELAHWHYKYTFSSAEVNIRTTIHNETCKYNIPLLRIT